jgi:hypothetical protein
MGGACGDLVMSVIDSVGSKMKDGRVYTKGYDPEDINTLRFKLKKPHVFSSDEKKDQFLIDISSSYSSIPSHDTEYHIKRNHQFITVVVSDEETALWASERFKSYHRPHIWDEMVIACGANSVEGYAEMLLNYTKRITQYTDKVIDIRSDILSGKLIEKMQGFVDTTLDIDFYNIWLSQQTR